MRQSIIDFVKKRPDRPDRRQEAHHPGLLLQRFLVDHESPEERRVLLDAAMNACRGETLRSLYRAAFARWNDSFADDESCQTTRLTTQGRLIVGLGIQTVLETGLQLHHTYGVPNIPGSALKGLASHHCDEVWGQRWNQECAEENRLFRRSDDEDEAGGEADARSYHDRLFGTLERSGVIHVHDAWLTPDSLDAGALRLDVMTPHHPKWQTGDAPPTDFDSPVPVSFLSVSGTFELRLSWCGPRGTPRDRAAEWTALAMTLLTEALADRGIGGKTTSGHGRLVRPGALNTAGAASGASTAQRGPLPTSGDTVEAQLLEEKTRKGGWRARHAPSGISGPIQNTDQVPGDQKPGDTVRLIVAIAKEQEGRSAFRYPTPADEARAAKTPAKNGRHKNRGPRRGGRRSRD